MAALLVFFSELRRRAVIRFAAIYAALAWVVLQFADLAFPRLGFPDWTITFILVIAAIGFPFGLVFAWIFERTPEGLKVTAPLSPNEKTASRSDRIWDIAIIAVLAALVGILYVQRLTTPSDQAVPATQSINVKATQPVRQPSIAVLPFSSLSTSEDNAYFAAGMHEDVMTHLSRIPGLKVISRTSMLKYADQKEKSVREIASELDVEHVLEGSVRRSGDQVRITIQLIDAAKDKHIWAQNYDRTLENIFALQTEVAEAIANQLEVRLSRDDLQASGRPTADLEVYDQFLKARQLADWWQDPLRAVEILRIVVKADPKFAEAHALLAKALLNSFGFGNAWKDIREETLQAAHRAVELSPVLDQGHLVLGMAYHRDDRLVEAAASLRTATSLNPNNGEGLLALANAIQGLGDLAGANKILEQGIEVDPLNALLHMQLGGNLAQSDPKRALTVLERARELNPDIPAIFAWIGNVAIATGQFDRYYDNWRLAIEMSNREILFPINIMAFYLASIGAHDLAESHMEEMRTISPRHELTYFSGANVMLAGSDPKRLYTEEFSRYVDDWLQNDPDNPRPYRYLADQLAAQARYAEREENGTLANELRQQAIKNYERSLQQYRREDGTYAYAAPDGFGVIHYGFTLAEAGEQEAAEKILAVALKQLEKEQLSQYEYMHVAAIYAGRGDIDAALNALATSVDRGLFSIWIFETYVNDWFPELHNNVRYKQIIARAETRNAEALAYVRSRETETNTGTK